jgi:hypothetical protein
VADWLTVWSAELERVHELTFAERRASRLRFMPRQSGECTDESLKPIFEELARIKRKLNAGTLIRKRTIPWARPRR